MEINGPKHQGISKYFEDTCFGLYQFPMERRNLFCLIFVHVKYWWLTQTIKSLNLTQHHYSSHQLPFVHLAESVHARDPIVSVHFLRAPHLLRLFTYHHQLFRSRIASPAKTKKCLPKRLSPNPNPWHAEAPPPPPLPPMLQQLLRPPETPTPISAPQSLT
jgi:hypothetical protein